MAVTAMVLAPASPYGLQYVGVVAHNREAQAPNPGLFFANKVLQSEYNSGYNTDLLRQNELPLETTMNKPDYKEIYNSEHGEEWNKIYNSAEFEAECQKRADEYPNLSEDLKVAAAENVQHLMDQGASMDPENYLDLYSASLEGFEMERE